MGSVLRPNIPEVLAAKAGHEAERVRTRLLDQVDQKRIRRTRATVGWLLNRVGRKGESSCCLTGVVGFDRVSGR